MCRPSVSSFLERVKNVGGGVLTGDYPRAWGSASADHRDGAAVAWFPAPRRQGSEETDGAPFDSKPNRPGRGVDRGTCFEIDRYFLAKVLIMEEGECEHWSLEAPVF